MSYPNAIRRGRNDTENSQKKRTAGLYYRSLYIFATTHVLEYNVYPAYVLGDWRNKRLAIFFFCVIGPFLFLFFKCRIDLGMKVRYNLLNMYSSIVLQIRVT
ncbi:hypothetical protein BS78_03G110000 [Paspalum vaginatum]|nr:hypothetical protein BS78_03G110000 [Paspalum vaginatum]